MRVDLPRPLAPGQVVDLDIGWHFTVPDYGAGRMGHDGSLYELGQWYPRMAVYDDVRGWNHEPYIGGGEFYLEYGRFDVALTVPAELRRGRDRRAAQSRAGAHRRSARAAGAGAALERRRWRSSAPTRRGRRPARGRRPGARSPGASRRTACATSRSPPRPDFRWDASGYRRHAGPDAVSPVGARNGRRPTASCATRSSTTASSGTRIPTRTSPPSKGRSRAWSIP